MSVRLSETKRGWRTAILVATAVTGVVAASAAAADAVSVIQARQTHYKEIGKAAKAMSDQLKSPTPSLPIIQAAVKQIDILAPQVPNWFPPGSGPEAGIKTQAKADIWARPEEFRRDAAAFTEAAHRLDLIAAGGDLPAIRAQAQVMGQSCKICHEAFRQRDD